MINHGSDGCYTVKNAKIPISTYGHIYDKKQTKYNTCMINWVQYLYLYNNDIIIIIIINEIFVMRLSKQTPQKRINNNNKNNNNNNNKNNYIFIPLACEVMGAWSADSIAFFDILAEKIHSITGDKRERNQLYQRLSIAIQRGNAACIQCCFSDGCFDADVLV